MSILSSAGWSRSHQERAISFAHQQSTGLVPGRRNKFSRAGALRQQFCILQVAIHSNSVRTCNSILFNTSNQTAKGCYFTCFDGVKCRWPSVEPACICLQPLISKTLLQSNCLDWVIANRFCWGPSKESGHVKPLTGISFALTYLLIEPTNHDDRSPCSFFWNARMEEEKQKEERSARIITAFYYFFLPTFQNSFLHCTNV